MEMVVKFYSIYFGNHFQILERRTKLLTSISLDMSLPEDWVDTPLTQWLVRNDVRSVNKFITYSGIGWDTGMKIVRGFSQGYKISAPTRRKLVNLGLPRATITAHEKAVAKLPRKAMLQKVAKTVPDNPIGLSYTDSVSKDDKDAVIASMQKELVSMKKLLQSVGSRLLHFDQENK